ncbi:MAG: hypothetical protein K2X82_22175 [Gemmataceae bacterium]|nr:hypothetical protein [Gemmataceae bacterium]
MRTPAFRNWLTRLFGVRGPVRRRRLDRPAVRRPAFAVETLECRTVPAAITYVDDDWALLPDGTLVDADPDPVGVQLATIGTDAFDTIQEGVDNVDPGGTVLVNPGTYTENVTIDMNLDLLSRSGRAVTTIQGISNAGALGAVTVTNNTTGVQIGDTAQGFTIVGIDNGNPAVENAAVYFQGNHSNAVVRDNEIEAAGDLGLLTEFSAVVSGFVIDGNEFSGKTFVGANPDGLGTSDQFTQPNRPRQVAVISGGVGGGNTSNVTFTGNTITATAGGLNPSNQEQGNSLVTIDSNGATITGNTFSGTTTRFGYQLRARGPSTTISGNTFNSGGLGSVS